MLRLPKDLRAAFKDPLGPITTDTAALLSAVEETRTEHAAPDAPLVAVGDVVTYHIRQGGTEPDVALIDGKTEREEVAAEIRRALADAGDNRIVVENPAGTISEPLLEAIRDAIDAPETTVIEVTGEEDLAALPAIVAAPLGSSVVYGQPGEGMVRVPVTPETAEYARDLLSKFDGDVDGALAVLGAETE